jgi:transposase
MYLRKTRRKYKGKVYEYYFLVEAITTPKGPRQKVICSLGDLRPRPASEWLKLFHRVESALAGQEDLFEDLDDPEVQEILERIAQRRDSLSSEQTSQVSEEIVSIRSDTVRTERHREAGPEHVGLQFWSRLGLDEILEQVGLSRRAQLLTTAMVMNRLIQPSSEHAMPDWIRSTALDDLLGESFATLAEDSLYRNLDRLHPNRGEIESALAERERSLFGLEETVFFYDLTSTYFEGSARANPKAQRGYSRDQRPDCPQVVIGLVIGREGFPVAHEVFEGSRQDRASLDEMLDILAERVQLVPGQTVVVDRGMAFEENLEQIRARGLHYIVASRQAERAEWEEDFARPAGFEEVHRSASPRNPAQRKAAVRIKKARKDGVTYVLCTSEGREKKDRGIRDRQEARLRDDLDRLARRIGQGHLVQEVKIGEAIGRIKERYPRVARYWHMTFDPETRKLEIEADEARREQARHLDGAYLLKTDREDLSGEEIWNLYMLLTRAENAFRNMKSPLAERPIFHQLQHRVETHIFLCLLAYHLLVAIERTLLDRGIHTSWTTVRETLSTHQVCTVVLETTDGRTLGIRRDAMAEPEHKELYRLLGLTAQIMQPKRTWSESNHQQEQ